MKTIKVPGLFHRIYSVWFRHMKVYTKNFLSNAFPPLLEPFIFLAGIGLGLGVFIKQMDGIPYLLFLGTGLCVTPAMFSAAYECSFGTFIRLEFDKVYDSMLAAPITFRNLIWGELLFAGTKGFIFSFSVTLVLFATGVLKNPAAAFVPIVGFFTGLVFATVSMFVTSFITYIDSLNFYFTGFISPMFFFSGVIFPVSSLPPAIRFVSEIVPLTHLVRPARCICLGRWDPLVPWDVIYVVLFIALFGFLATLRLKKKLVN